MFTLLHVSDLHRSEADPISNNELVSALIADADRYGSESPSISRPDALIVSGDLVHGLPLDSPDYPAGLARQFEEALELLISLAEVFVGGDRSKVVLVQGNHDVDWNMARKAMAPVDMSGQNVRRLLEKRHSRYRWCWRDRKLYEISDPALYDQRFDYFAAMYERFYNGTPLVYEADPRRPWNLFNLASGRLVVAAFNSCVANDCFGVQGEIPAEAISESHLALINARPSPDLRIAVWHHDVEGPPFRTDYWTRILSG